VAQKNLKFINLTPKNHPMADEIVPWKYCKSPVPHTYDELREKWKETGGQDNIAEEEEKGNYIII
jgi:hypothetical protein